MRVARPQAIASTPKYEYTLLAMIYALNLFYSLFVVEYLMLLCCNCYPVISAFRVYLLVKIVIKGIVSSIRLVGKT